MEISKVIDELQKTNDALLSAYMREAELVMELTKEVEELKKQIKKLK